MIDAAQYDRRILIEKGVDAREIEVSVLGNDNPQVSFPGEIRPNADFYSYEAKYILPNSELIIPAVLSQDQITRIQAFAKRAYIAADCAGMARADFLLDKNSGDIELTRSIPFPDLRKSRCIPNYGKHPVCHIHN